MALVETSRPAEGVLLVELNDPERYNALSSRMITELKDTFAGLKDDRETRVVIIAAGAGDSAPAPTWAATTRPPSGRRAGGRSGSSTSTRSTSPS